VSFSKEELEERLRSANDIVISYMSVCFEVFRLQRTATVFIMK